MQLNIVKEICSGVNYIYVKSVTSGRKPSISKVI